MKEARYKVPHVWFHLYEVSRTGKPIETESRFVAARGRGWGDREWLLNKYGVSFWSNKNVLGLNSGDGGCELVICNKKYIAFSFRSLSMVIMLICIINISFYYFFLLRMVHVFLYLHMSSNLGWYTGHCDFTLWKFCIQLHFSKKYFNQWLGYTQAAYPESWASAKLLFVLLPLAGLLTVLSRVWFRSQPETWAGKDRYTIFGFLLSETPPPTFLSSSTSHPKLCPLVLQSRKTIGFLPEVVLLDMGPTVTFKAIKAGTLTPWHSFFSKCQWPSRICLPLVTSQCLVRCCKKPLVNLSRVFTIILKRIGLVGGSLAILRMENHFCL